MAEREEHRAAVLGVDAARHGWVAVRLLGGRLQGLDRAREGEIDGLIARHPDAAWIGVDMPIGVVECGPRTADIEARAMLGRRSPSLFLTPARSVLAEADWSAARLAARRLGGPGLTRQAHGLRRRIAEVAPLALADPRVIEVHPELSFVRMGGAGAPRLESKHTALGVFQRRDLLMAQGIDCGRRALLGAGQGVEEILARVAMQDVLDAAAAAWTAERRRRGRSVPVPDSQVEADGGRPIVIWS